MNGVVRKPANDGRSISVGNQLAFVFGATLALLVLFSGLRAALFAYNHALAEGQGASVVLAGFANGMRFDLRVVALAVLPLVLALLSVRTMRARCAQVTWLTVVASITGFIGIVELDFYREFNQRLNGLAIEYMKEDPGTVSSMIWHGFPVVRYLLAWALVTGLMYGVFRWFDQRCASSAVAGAKSAHWAKRLIFFLVLLPIVVVAARGTLRQGSPLRWGDAYTTDSPFINALGLNGTLTFTDAVRAHFSEQRRNVWKTDLSEQVARETVRTLLLLPTETPYDIDAAPVRRVMHNSELSRLPVKNVVVVLMESFAGRYVGALGSQLNITPNFDALTKEGVLFTRFFSNGTHTHQGMFATMGCFPNLPGFEYLMKTPESHQQFSGLPQLLANRGFDDIYVYNGDFMWDNQRGFFGAQGMSRFIGRTDYVNPVFSDPTWGVSDQDMFDRAAQELAKMPAEKPFYALLQTLSNHTPYALPKQLPVAPVTDQGSFNEHLTAMRYSDWALGQFFEKARKEPYFNNTLFIVVGDHGFASDIQLTEMNLTRFHVPMLMIAPGIQKLAGKTRDTIASQVDIAPTVLGRLGGTVPHQCWGRDLLSLPPGDKGYAIIKPSGGEKIVGMVRDGTILIKSQHREPQMYNYGVGFNPFSEQIPGDAAADAMSREMDAYVQTATDSLMARQAGVGTPPATTGQAGSSSPSSTQSSPRTQRLNNDKGK